MTAIATPPKMQFVDSNGKPLVGGKLYTYAAGTTTPLATYTDYAGGTPNANPIILNSRGEADVWLGTARYKFKLTTSTNVDVWTVDNVGGMATLAQLAASGGSALVGYLPAGTGAVATTAQAKLRESVSVKDFGAKGDGVTDDTATIQAALNTAKRVYAPTGTYIYSALSIPSNTALYGDGPGLTVFQLKASSNPAVASIQNSNTSSGNTGIYISGIGFNGTYSSQTVGSIAAFTKITNSTIQDCAIYNGYNHGLLLSGGSGNYLRNVLAYTNGKNGPGYGIFLSNSSSNKVADCVTYDNCIGLAIEASASGSANDNQVSNHYAYSNRADFSQSGAGIHCEAATGNQVYRTNISNSTCTSNLGCGLILTGVGVDSANITNSTLSNNTKAGFISLASTNFYVSNSHIVNNGAGESAGYTASARFDDTGYVVYSSGLMSGCKIQGTGTNVVSVKSFAIGSAVRFENCDLTGSTSGEGSLAGNLDTIKRPGWYGFFANLTAASITASAIVVFDSAVISTPQYSASTGVFTCTDAGFYQFSTSALSNGTTCGIGIRKNSSYYATNRTAGTSGTVSASCSAIIKLAVGDTVDVYCFSGGCTAGASNTFFTGSKIA